MRLIALLGVAVLAGSATRASAAPITLEFVAAPTAGYGGTLPFAELPTHFRFTFESSFIPVELPLDPGSSYREFDISGAFISATIEIGEYSLTTSQAGGRLYDGNIFEGGDQVSFYGLPSESLYLGPDVVELWHVAFRMPGTFWWPAEEDGPVFHPGGSLAELALLAPYTGFAFLEGPQGMAWDNVSFADEASSVPEPGSILLLGSGLVAMVSALRRRATNR